MGLVRWEGKAGPSGPRKGRGSQPDPGIAVSIGPNRPWWQALPLSPLPCHARRYPATP